MARCFLWPFQDEMDRTILGERILAAEDGAQMSNLRESLIRAGTQVGHLRSDDDSALQSQSQYASMFRPVQNFDGWRRVPSRPITCPRILTLRLWPRASVRICFRSL